MAKYNFYAVKFGKKPGIYKTWAGCKSQVDGFSGAKYKGFKTEAEALTFMNGALKPKVTKAVKTPQVIKPVTKKAPAKKVANKTKVAPQIKVTNANIDKFIKNMADDEIAAFVDGSYNLKTGYYGSGIVLIDNKFHNIEITELGNDPAFMESNNVAGEVIAAELAIKVAVKMQKAKVTIFHDYNGIEKWGTDTWKANKPISITYKATIAKLRPLIKISFIKVAAHTDITYNERADKLAKRAAGGGEK